MKRQIFHSLRKFFSGAEAALRAAARRGYKSNRNLSAIRVTSERTVRLLCDAVRWRLANAS
jgi:hypothetical protein